MTSTPAPQRPSTGTRLAWLTAAWSSTAIALAVSWGLARWLDVRAWPVVAIAEQIIRHTPGGLAESAIQHLGHRDKPTLVAVILVLLTIFTGLLGWFGRRWPWLPVLGFAVMSAFAGLCVAAEHGEGPHGQWPVVIGLLVWVAAWTLCSTPLRENGPKAYEDASYENEEGSRRAFLRVALVAVAAGIGGLIAPGIGAGRAAAESARSRLRLPGVTKPVVPAGADLHLAQPWLTPASQFYRVDTTLSPPALDPATWSLRIHGMVDHEVRISFKDLLDRQLTEDWITLNCVSNTVGGSLIGNGWWSGVKISSLLAEAGVHPGADAVLQTSIDGWTCGTPLSTLTDSRNAMLAMALNGEALPIEHGFPVRTIVPGLYGYVSACKWVVDFEVTTMPHAVGYWVPLGWSQEGPVKLASRIDRPRDGQNVAPGTYTIAGSAWDQDVGIAGVEVSLDQGPWHKATLAAEPTIDSWVQWKVDLPVAAGNHDVRVRATNRDGQTQTPVQAPPIPNGATGWDQVSFSAG